MSSFALSTAFLRNIQRPVAPLNFAARTISSVNVENNPPLVANPSASDPADKTHVIDGKIIDPTIDKDPKHWVVTTDPPPDVHLVHFENSRINYSSYDPPKGFTAQELAQFTGADQCLSEQAAQNLIDMRNKLGTLEIVE